MRLVKLSLYWFPDLPLRVYQYLWSIDFFFSEMNSEILKTKNKNFVNNSGDLLKLPSFEWGAPQPQVLPDPVSQKMIQKDKKIKNEWAASKSEHGNTVKTVKTESSLKRTNFFIPTVGIPYDFTC